MKVMLVPILTVTLLAGCSGSPSSEPCDAAFVPGPHVISLLQDTPRPGSTSAGVTPTVVLRGAGRLGGDTAAVLTADLQQRVLFVSADGQTVGAAPVNIVADGNESLLNVQPATPLLADTWYDVTYPTTALSFYDGGAEFQPRIRSIDIHYLGDGVLTRFFTGSAPQLSDVIMMMEKHDGGAGTSRSLVVTLSEPLPLADLLSGGFQITVDTVPIQGTCLIGGRPCDAPPPLPSVSPMEATTWFLYQLDSDLPARFEVALSLLLKGVARTAQEAWDAGMVRGTTTASGGFLRYAMDTASWRGRDAVSGGWMLGWSNVE